MLSSAGTARLHMGGAGESALNRTGRLPELCRQWQGSQFITDSDTEVPNLCSIPLTTLFLPKAR